MYAECVDCIDVCDRSRRVFFPRQVKWFRFCLNVFIVYVAFRSIETFFFSFIYLIRLCGVFLPLFFFVPLQLFCRSRLDTKFDLSDARTQNATTWRNIVCIFSILLILISILFKRLGRLNEQCLPAWLIDWQWADWYSVEIGLSIRVHVRKQQCWFYEKLIDENKVNRFDAALITIAKIWPIAFEIGIARNSILPVYTTVITDQWPAKSTFSRAKDVKWLK